MGIFRKCRFTLIHVSLIILLVAVRLAIPEFSVLDLGNALGSIMPEMPKDSALTWIVGFALAMVAGMIMIGYACLLVIVPYLLAFSIGADMLFNRLDRIWLLIPALLFIGMTAVGWQYRLSLYSLPIR